MQLVSKVFSYTPSPHLKSFSTSLSSCIFNISLSTSSFIVVCGKFVVKSDDCFLHTWFVINLLKEPMIGRCCLCIAVELRQIAVPLYVSLIVSISASIVSRYFLNEVFCKIKKFHIRIVAFLCRSQALVPIMPWGNRGARTLEVFRKIGAPPFFPLNAWGPSRLVPTPTYVVYTNAIMVSNLTR